MISRLPNEFFLLGDSGYALRPWLLTPLDDPIEEPEKRYNRAHKSTRTIIEHVNGILKGRFRCCSKYRVMHYHPEVASKIINTCCVLHNMCVEHKIPLDITTEDEIDFLDGLYVNVDPADQEENGTGRVLPILAEARRFQKTVIRRSFS